MDIKVYLPDDLYKKFLKIPIGNRSYIMQKAFKEYIERHDIDKVISEK